MALRDTADMPDDAGGTFLTHARYVRAFATMCGQAGSRQLPHNMQVRAQDVKSRLVMLTSVAPPDIDAVRRSLHNAWGTELLLASSYEWLEEDDLIRINNCWAVIQTYYVHYHAMQALRVALGHERPTSHPTTQNLFGDMWAGRSANFAPCTLGVGASGPVNVPQGVTIDPDIHPWANSDEESCWSLAALALKTTRADVVKEKKSARRETKRRARERTWRDEEAERIAKGRKARKEPTFSLPQLNEPEKRQIETSVRRFTIIDYLYRLRVKANYLDSTVFTEGPEDEETSRRVLKDLKDIAANSLLVHELHIRSLVPEVDSIADDWLGARSNSPNVGLLLRRSHW